MGKDKGFRKLGDLVAALGEAERGLASGTLGLDGLEAACGDARELYERLVVLRHKAREAALAPPAPAPPPRTKATAPVAEKKERPAAPAPSSAVSEPVSIRLDTRPPETSRPEAPPRQTSLIEAIEATEQAPDRKEASATPAAKPGDKPPATVAEKLEKSAIADLGKAISLSHKFWFVAELFNGDKTGYEKTIVTLNGLDGKDAAMALMREEVLSKLKKPADPEALAAFMELIERRFA